MALDEQSKTQGSQLMIQVLKEATSLARQLLKNLCYALPAVHYTLSHS